MKFDINENSITITEDGGLSVTYTRVPEVVRQVLGRISWQLREHAKHSRTLMTVVNKSFNDHDAAEFNGYLASLGLEEINFDHLFEMLDEIEKRQQPRGPNEMLSRAVGLSGQHLG